MADWTLALTRPQTITEGQNRASTWSACTAELDGCAVSWSWMHAVFSVRRAGIHRQNTVFDAGETPFAARFLRIRVTMVF